MSEIKLNLKARKAEQVKYWDWRKEYSTRYGVEDIPLTWTWTKKGFAMVKNHLGIKVARKLIKSFRDSGLCPQINRVSFSTVVITY